MDYLHDRDRSLSCLRTTVSLMGKHAAVLDPVSYAVWYDYAAGGSAELKKLLDDLVAKGGLLGQDRTRELFLNYVAQPANDPALETLNQVLSTHTGQTVARIKEDTERDNIMTSTGALEYGLIDEVIAPVVHAEPKKR